MLGHEQSLYCSKIQGVKHEKLMVNTCGIQELEPLTASNLRVLEEEPRAMCMLHNCLDTIIINSKPGESNNFYYLKKLKEIYKAWSCRVGKVRSSSLIFYHIPSLIRSSWHEWRTIACTIFTATHSTSNKQQSFGFKVLTASLFSKLYKKKFSLKLVKSKTPKKYPSSFHNFQLFI